MAFDADFALAAALSDAADAIALPATWPEDDDEDPADYAPRRKANRERRAASAPVRRRAPHPPAARAPRGPSRDARRGTEEFKCRHCRAFVGPTVAGGRHRNHCPFCLHSRHVDDRRPGDRASACGATMAPVARFDRPGGEPVLVHRCFGCGLERHNRLAADDNIALLPRLPLVAPRLGLRSPAVAPDDITEVSVPTQGPQRRIS